MDIQRRPIKPSQQPRSMDGFFSKPAQPVARLANQRFHGAMPDATGGNGVQGQRKIHDFGRTEGFHAAPRRGAHSQSTAAAGHSVGLKFSLPVDATSKFITKRSAHLKGQPHSNKLRTIRRWGFRTVAAALILVVVIGGLLFGKGYFQLKKVFTGTTSAAALHANVDPTLLKGEGDGRVNILMLGIGGANHDGADLTDTMMVASVDPVNNQAVLLSIPRDLWTKMPNNYIANYQKINAAYESGKYKYLGKLDDSSANKKAVEAGFQAADGVVERAVGIPIHYNMLVNFQAFRQAVDTVGGISVNATEQLYDPTMAWENDRNPVLAKLGINNFDGRHALNFVRSRETSSDFSRAQRQRQVIVALKDKVINLGTLTNPLKLSNLLTAFGDNVQSDISLADTTRLANIMKKISNNQIQSVGLADAPNNFLTTGNINGLSVVEPRAGLEDYTAIQAFVRSKLKDGYIAQENTKVGVLNGTVTPGLATQKADQLKTYGYNIVNVDNAPTTDYDTTTIYNLAGQTNKYTLNYLKNRYHVTTIKTELPAGIVQKGADVVIVLGLDAAADNSN